MRESETTMPPSLGFFRARDWCVLLQAQVSPILLMVGDVFAQSLRRCSSLNTAMRSRISCRAKAAQRSAMPFPQGLLNEVLAGLMPMELIVRITSVRGLWRAAILESNRLVKPLRAVRQRAPIFLSALLCDAITLVLSSNQLSPPTPLTSRYRSRSQNPAPLRISP